MSTIDEPHAALEQIFIDEYLASLGHTQQSARALPASEAAPMFRAASEYASLRLAEIEARAHYVDEVHRGR